MVKVGCQSKTKKKHCQKYHVCVQLGHIHSPRIVDLLNELGPEFLRVKALQAVRNLRQGGGSPFLVNKFNPVQGFEGVSEERHTEVSSQQALPGDALLGERHSFVYPLQFHGRKNEKGADRLVDILEIFVKVEVSKGEKLEIAILLIDREQELVNFVDGLVHVCLRRRYLRMEEERRKKKIIIPCEAG